MPWHEHNSYNSYNFVIESKELEHLQQVHVKLPIFGNGTQLKTSRQWGQNQTGKSQEKEYPTLQIPIKLQFN